MDILKPYIVMLLSAAKGAVSKDSSSILTNIMIMITPQDRRGQPKGTVIVPAGGNPGRN